MTDDDDLDSVDPVELVHDAIEALADATDTEREDLHELLGNLGFGGREATVQTPEEASALAREQLAWLRQQTRG